jgi:hypothetical protein
MSSLDLLYLAQPLVVLAASVLLLWSYHRRHLLGGAVLTYSLAAYFLAIGGKVMVQLAIAAPSNPYEAGAYYGLQTVLLEVGLAYVFARYGIVERRLHVEQAPAYGASLAFWENGVLLGVLAIPGLVAAIAAGGAGLPTGSLGQVAELVALGTLERASSIIAHFSWGLLVLVAAASQRVRFLLIALPMGLVDFLVPFAPSISLAEFEAVVFGLALLSLGVTYFVTKDEWPMFWRSASLPPATAGYTYTRLPDPGRLTPAGSSPPPPGVDRPRCAHCGAVFEAAWNPLLPHLGSRQLRKCPACGRRSFMERHADAPVTWPRPPPKPP